MRLRGKIGKDVNANYTTCTADFTSRILKPFRLRNTYLGWNRIDILGFLWLVSSQYKHWGISIRFEVLWRVNGSVYGYVGIEGWMTLGFEALGF